MVELDPLLNVKVRFGLNSSKNQSFKGLRSNSDKGFTSDNLRGSNNISEKEVSGLDLNNDN